MEAFKENLRGKKNQNASQSVLLFKIICGSHVIKFRLLIHLNLDKQNFYIHPLSDFFKASRLLTGMNMYSSRYSGSSLNLPGWC